MSVLIATPKAADGNSYLTVAQADTFLGQRLYTEKWDGAGTTPDAEGYLVNNGAGYPTTTTAIEIDTGTGTFTASSKIKFAGHATEYTVEGSLTGAGALTISPGLTSAVADDEVITRLTANERERALIWATTTFDNLMVWAGTKTTVAQRLRWPRIGVVDADGNSYDSDLIPELLEIAAADYGLVLLERNKLGLPAILGQGISKAKLGPLSVEVDDEQQEDAIPQNILALLSPLGRLEPEAQVGSAILPVRRA